jgi:hypothetical protein
VPRRRTWPKVCGGCRRAHDEESWASLTFVGIQKLPPGYEDLGIPDLEMRNCVCHSTIAQPVKKSPPPG